MKLEVVFLSGSLQLSGSTTWMNTLIKGFEENGVETDQNVMQREEKKEEEWIKDVKKMDPLSMSPLQALNFLYELKKKMEN